MSNIIYTDGTGVPHRSFEEEFLTHKKCSEWWYATGYFETKQGKLFSFQYTLAKIKIRGITLHLQLNALTDIENGKHYYSQKPFFTNKDITTTQYLTSAKDLASIAYSANDNCSFGYMHLELLGDEYKLNLEMYANKAPVWHCEDGKLKMGYTDDPEQVTYYYSITNMSTKGTLLLDGELHEVTGKAWFDRQGGTYTPTDVKCNWEWFSLRFNNHEEMMLFVFPHTNYQDGTYIKQDGGYERFNNYEITYHEIIEASGYKWSNGWTLKLNDESNTIYEITPLVDGQFNLFFFELLAKITNQNDEIVGYCFVELLPGARNDKISARGAFKHSK